MMKSVTVPENKEETSVLGTGKLKKLASTALQVRQWLLARVLAVRLNLQRDSGTSDFQTLLEYLECTNSVGKHIGGRLGGRTLSEQSAAVYADTGPLLPEVITGVGELGLGGCLVFSEGLLSEFEPSTGLQNNRNRQNRQMHC